MTPIVRRLVSRRFCLVLFAALGVAGAAAAQEPETPPAGKERMKAPELAGGAAWLNTAQPLTLADLKGKIVLLDFWTFG